MREFLVENWPLLIAVVIYALERSGALKREYRERIRACVDAIERAANVGEPSAKDAVKGSPIRGDIVLNTVLDEVSPKEKKRVSVGRKILDVALKLLPLVSRLKGLGG